MLGNNSAYVNALYSAGRLEGIGKTKTLVRDEMINFFVDVFDSLDSILASLPEVLKRYETKGYDTEALQRAVLREGFSAVQQSVYNDTLAQAAKLGLYPSVQKELAKKNMASIPQGLKPEIEALVLEFNSSLSEFSEVAEIGVDGLKFSYGRLRVPSKFREEIPAKFTIPVDEKTRKGVEKIRAAAAVLAEIKKDFSPVIYDMVAQMAKGKQYTDSVLVSVLLGLPVPR